jgi:NAD(P)H-hydrate repair Nnr-like enzyme with NAD(P)H-hydrate dehydratase domain
VKQFITTILFNHNQDSRLQVFVCLTKLSLGRIGIASSFVAFDIFIVAIGAVTVIVDVDGQPWHVHNDEEPMETGGV